ncbi:hypothetical protein AVEN_261651-1 [Araneus ventricosus]|uniref:Tc1-like transposase DDE domain-containing protein n=1 Tax=Araneus ventricosus TaxID=182803 RepID=A0A4Y2W9U8_ARAVE|nr:hypothetical protein AVEN_261651-1 [Araneus ventricosus]
MKLHYRVLSDADGSHFIFISDKALRHTAFHIKEFQENQNIRQMDWLVISPDLNHIEHICNAPKSAIVTSPSPHRIFQHLKRGNGLLREPINYVSASFHFMIDVKPSEEIYPLIPYLI